MVGIVIYLLDTCHFDNPAQTEGYDEDYAQMSAYAQQAEAQAEEATPGEAEDANTLSVRW